MAWEVNSWKTALVAVESEGAHTKVATGTCRSYSSRASVPAPTPCAVYRWREPFPFMLVSWRGGEAVLMAPNRPPSASPGRPPWLASNDLPGKFIMKIHAGATFSEVLAWGSLSGDPDNRLGVEADRWVGEELQHCKGQC